MIQTLMFFSKLRFYPTFPLSCVWNSAIFPIMFYRLQTYSDNAKSADFLLSVSLLLPIHFSSRCLPLIRVLKRPFVFLQGNTNFYCCTEKYFRFFTEKYKILKTVFKWPFIILQRNTKIWRLYSNGHFFFNFEIRNT